MRLRRNVAVAALALVGGLLSVSQASAEPAQSSVREYVYITYRAPAPPLGACAAPSDSDSSSAYALAPWKISPTLDVTLSTQNVPSSVGSGFQTALNAAIGTWEGTQVPNNAFGSVTASNVRPRQRLDGTNLVGFGHIGSAVGSTRFWVYTATGTVAEFDTLLNSNYPWSTASSGNVEDCSGTPGAFDVQAVLTHELGHPIGLEHVDNDVQTMYPFVGTGETRKRTLADGDTTGVNLQY
jgi:hypothetical protein